jgi:hypothetical protein
VFTVGGVFVRHVGVGHLELPIGVACSGSGAELVVADYRRHRVFVFCAASGKLVRTMNRCGTRRRHLCADLEIWQVRRVRVKDPNAAATH